MKKLFQDIRAAIRDPERPLTERLYLALSIVSEILVLIAFVGDVLCHEDIKELLALIATLIAVPLITIISLRRDKLRIGIRVVVVCLVFLILPALFFFGGGVYGGGVLWIIFTFMYIGLVMEGVERIVFLVLLFCLALACFLAEYFFPRLVTRHTAPVFFVDSFISLIMVGIVCFVMSRLQNRFFETENQRAKEAAEKAEELNRSQNRFFSSMSHEIRTPINSILGLNELILRDETVSDEVAKDATGIQGAGKMLLALINDILDFSKIEAGSMDIVPVDYQVGDMLSEIVNMMFLRATDKGLKFEVSIDPQVPSVLYGDEVRIKQVVINLLNNAVKYTASGKVELHIESGAVDEKTTELTIAVTDTGMGIRKEALPHLFDAFKRVDEEKNRTIEGTGLGLSIVKLLAELMGGTVTVNSVYGEGSTFTFTVKQGISDPTAIGELNIHSQAVVRRKAYESSFRAPEARILIVDDNEMNLEVEAKLLAATDMTIDLSLSGKEALKETVTNHYDVILMDHLMPEMDGIECMEKIRNQTGGLNRSTPIVVLTANAGSDNLDLYTRSGFDGYLVKPVSGEALEQMLMKYISKEKVIQNRSMTRMDTDISATAGYAQKAPVIITSTSMCDLPYNVVKALKIPLLPFLVHTDESIFKDGKQMGADELIRFLLAGKRVESAPPDEKAFTEFFAENLRKAHHLIHISLTTGMSQEYQIASEAAKSFDNVTVINSECLSSSTGILVLIAVRLAEQNVPVEDIVTELEAVKQRLRCSFVIDKTDYMARNGRISRRVHRLARALNLHPSLQMKEDKAVIGGIWIGSTRRAYRRYIRKALPVDIIPDSEVVFITYADVPTETLFWIKEEISRIAYFENVVFVQAAAAVSANCGPGSFGILYFVKSNKSYNLTAFFDNGEDAENADDAGELYDEEEDAGLTAPQIPEAETAGTGKTSTEEEKQWYHGIDGIDGDMAMKHSGSEEAFRTVLKIFYDSIGSKTTEIEGYYAEGDWENYTIKVHALKSSAKLVGAMALAEAAQLLENDGKEKDTNYIRAHHDPFMTEYGCFQGRLAPVFGETKDPGAEKKAKPVADAYLIQTVYEGVQEAAEKMDVDAIEEILEEIRDYALPEEEQETVDAIRTAVEIFDYDGILNALRKG
ncbi:MAG: DegV family EDD domain-containing protein [Lachnospiraceae bacterium]|nr:DegV family EDD domain-containing protein [Lachnospiraceae bacterium]